MIGIRERRGRENEGKEMVRMHTDATAQCTDTQMHKHMHKHKHTDATTQCTSTQMHRRTYATAQAQAVKHKHTQM